MMVLFFVCEKDGKDLEWSLNFFKIWYVEKNILWL